MLRALFRRFLAPQARRRRDRRPLPAVLRPRLEALEDRVVPSTVTWVHSGDGDWGVGANWSSGATPGTNDDVVIDAAVTVTHSSGSDSVKSLTVSQGTLDLTGGALAFSSSATVDGALLIDGGTLDLTDKTLGGSGSTTVEPGASWTLAHSTVNTTLDNQGHLTAKSGVDLTNTFSNDSGATLTVVGDGTGTVDLQQLRIADGFTNHGTIETTTDATNHYVTIGVTSGTLTNASDGTIHTLAGGGPATLQTQLDNQGTITVEGELTVSKTGTFTDSNSGTINVSGADMSVSNGALGTTTTFVNTGDIEVSAGRTFSVQYNGAKFKEDGTAGGTIGGAGTLHLNGLSDVQFAGDFTTGSLNLFFENNIDYKSDGKLTVSSGTTLTLFRSDTIDAALENAGTVLVRGTSSFKGDFSNDAGATLRVEGNMWTLGAGLTVAGGFTNDGTIELGSVDGAYNATLTVTSGTLTNAGDGVINFLSDTGGSRTLNAALDNEGNVTAGTSATVSAASVTQVNNGTIEAAGGTLTFALSGSGAGFTNNGTLLVDAGATLAVGGALTNFSGGTLSGGTYDIAGTFKFNNAAVATNDAALILDGPDAKVVNQSNADALSGLNANTANGSLVLVDGAALSVASFGNAGYVEIDDTAHLTVGGTYTQTGGTTNLGGGTLTAGTLIDIEGGLVEGAGTLDGSVYNAGTVEVGVAGTPGVLTVTGDYTQASGGDLYLEIGGTNAGTDYGQLRVGGTANLDGTLSVVLINGFTPDGQSTYQVLTAGAVSGTFATLDHDGANFAATYDATDVTLQ